MLTKAAFLHRDWLAVFTQLAPAAMRAHIDAHRNCEDIAMQMVVSHFTQARDRQPGAQGAWPAASCTWLVLLQRVPSIARTVQEPPVAVINRKIRDEGAAGGSGQKSAVSGKKDHVGEHGCRREWGGAGVSMDAGGGGVGVSLSGGMGGAGVSINGVGLSVGPTMALGFQLASPFAHRSRAE